MAETKNLKSNDIAVFPSINRAVNPNQNRLFTEYNLTKLINQWTDTISFVITDVYSGNSKFEFNINGYYFHIDSGEKITSLFTNDLSETLPIYIIAEILINDSFELNGYDEELNYTGVSFNLYSDENAVQEIWDNGKITTAQGTIYRLPILHYLTQNKWEIPWQSKIKFKSKSIQSIDGGEI